jgi:hypothetical protein
MIGTYLFYVGIRLDDTDTATDKLTKINKKNTVTAISVDTRDGGEHWYARQLRPFQAYWTYTFDQLTQDL